MIYVGIPINQIHTWKENPNVVQENVKIMTNVRNSIRDEDWDLRKPPVHVGTW